MASENTFISFYLKTSTIRVFKKAIKLIEYPSYVRFLIHPIRLQIAMTAYNKKKLTSFRVPVRLLNDETNVSLCIHSKRLCLLVSQKMGWEAEKSYRVPGRRMMGKKAFVFNLNEAYEVTRNQDTR